MPHGSVDSLSIMQSKVECMHRRPIFGKCKVRSWTWQSNKVSRYRRKKFTEEWRAASAYSVSQGIVDQQEQVRAVGSALKRINKKWSGAGAQPESKRALVYEDPVLLQAAQDAGLKDLLFVSEQELDTNSLQSHSKRSTLGNDRGTRFWQGPLSSVPAYQGLFEIAVLGEIALLEADLRSALLPLTLISKPGAYILLSNHPSKDSLPKDDEGPESGNGRKFLEKIIYDLPLRIDAFGGNGKSWISILQVPPAYTFSRCPIFAEEVVVTGFGRGSKQMGVPTANLKPESLFQGALKDLPLGVYFGWAQVPSEDIQVYKTVLNIGKRPSIEDGEERTVELHILHQFGRDFYGKHLKFVMTGFIRPEVRFPSLSALIAQINADKGIAKTQLETEQHCQYKNDTFFET